MREIQVNEAFSTAVTFSCSDGNQMALGVLRSALSWGPLVRTAPTDSFREPCELSRPELIQFLYWERWNNIAYCTFAFKSQIHHLLFRQTRRIRGFKATKWCIYSALFYRNLLHGFGDDLSNAVNLWWACGFANIHINLTEKTFCAFNATPNRRMATDVSTQKLSKIKYSLVSTNNTLIAVQLCYAFNSQNLVCRRYADVLRFHWNTMKDFNKQHASASHFSQIFSDILQLTIICCSWSAAFTSFIFSLQAH